MRHSVHPETSDSLSKWLLYLQIIGATFLQKIAFPTGNEIRIFVAFILMMCLTATGIIFRRFFVCKMRCALYLFMVGVLTFIQIIGDNTFSLPSLILLLAIHLPYIFALRDDSIDKNIGLLFFQKIMVFLAILGLLQFGLQYVIDWKDAFFLDTHLPAQWVMSGFNNINAIKYGSHFHKSNGIFMLEPAEFCQFLAISIIIEMVYFKRLIYMLFYIAGVLTTFSGTGLIILCLIVPLYLFRRGRYITLLTIGVVLLIFIVTAPFTGLDNYIGRVSEFSNSHTSGYARFISIFPLLYEFTLQQADTLLLGHGAGWSKTIYGHVDYEIHPPGWGKIWLEYGLIGLLVYGTFMLRVLWDSAHSIFLKAALTIEYFFDDYVLIPTVHGIIIALLAWPPKKEKDSKA